MRLLGRRVVKLVAVGSRAPRTRTARMRISGWRAARQGVLAADEAAGKGDLAVRSRVARRLMNRKRSAAAELRKSR